MLSARLVPALLAGSLLSAPVLAQQESEVPPAVDTNSIADDLQPQASGDAGVIVVTARRRAESVQDVPIAVSVVDGTTLDATGSFNVNRLQQLVPTLQFYSSNPRNTALNIRGLGAPFGLTNDGIEQGVGIYIDGVYYARVAASTFDFLDVDRIEVLRGPQGTLYGKNTTAGALNITTRRPTFDFEGRAELSVGDLGYFQAKGTVSGPLVEDRLAGRFVVSATKRDGSLFNVTTGEHVNGLDNLGLRGQLLWTPTDNLNVTLAGDFNRQDPLCCAQLFVRVAPTQRPLARQYEALANLLGYEPASRDPFVRTVDNDTPLQARQTFGGASLTADWDLGALNLTSITAWRRWDWDPSNDRDFTSLPITTISANPSSQDQWTQEFRLASAGDRPVDFVLGLFGFDQHVVSTGIQEQGSAASQWLLGPGTDPALLDGLRQETAIDYRNRSAALFGRLTWNITDSLRLQPGARINYDEKNATYDAAVSGGLQTTDPVLIARKNGVLQSQSYVADFDDWNLSYDVNLSWDVTPDIMVYATYSHGFKSGGVNLSGIPNRADGTPATELATVAPETVDHYEAGVKTRLLDGAVTLNAAAFRTDVEDYQATVVNGAIGVLRGYLANADEVRTQGIEADVAARPFDGFSLYANAAYTDAKYVSFRDAPPPLEQSGGAVQVVDISGQVVPGVSKWSLSYGGEYAWAGSILGEGGEWFAALDGNYRSRFSSSPTPSAYMFIDGYALTNARVGFRGDADWGASVFVRNLFDTEYFDFLTAQSGSTGLIVGQPGDPRTIGINDFRNF